MIRWQILDFAKSSISVENLLFVTKDAFTKKCIVAGNALFARKPSKVPNTLIRHRSPVQRWISADVDVCAGLRRSVRVCGGGGEE